MKEWGKNWFGEKTHQVECSSTAFGVEISSRHGKFDEIQEMMNFAELLAEFGVEPMVKSVLYDSPTSLAIVELDTSAYRYWCQMEPLLEYLASRSLSQFSLVYKPHDYDSGIGHGYDFEFSDWDQKAQIADLRKKYEEMAKASIKMLLSLGCMKSEGGQV